MDSITQAVLGAAVGEAILGKKIGNKAAILGAAIATFPDLDVMLTPFFSELQKISIHRGFSHSILFCIIGAIVCVYVLKRIKWTRDVSKWKLWVFGFLTLFTHILLDAFTTYGTQLFLPFNDWRVSFDSINIIDPFYTVPLAIGLLISIFKLPKSNGNRSIPNTIGLIISSLYLIYSLSNKQHIERIISTQLAQQNIAHFDLLTVPVKVGNLNWYGVAKDQSNLYIGKYSQLDDNKIEFDKFPINNYLLDDLDDNLVDKMKWFAQGFYTVAQKGDKIRIYNMQCDMQGVREYGGYKAPTAFYFEVHKQDDGYQLSTGMHMKE